MPSPPYLQLECSIASAHKATYRAVQLADGMSLDGLQEDLDGILAELYRIQISLLRGPGSLPKTLSRRA